MRDIYIVLSHSGTRVSKFFRLFTGAEYTHTSICLDGKLDTFYSFARRNIKMPLFGGIVIEHPDEGILGMYPATCKIYKITVTDKQYKGIKNDIRKMMKDYDNYKYNFLGCPLIFFGIRLKRKKKFTCTQFVGYLLEHNNIDVLNIPWELSKPQDFNKPYVNVVYMGLVKNLKTI